MAGGQRQSHPSARRRLQLHFATACCGRWIKKNREEMQVMAGKKTRRGVPEWPLLTFAAAHHQLLTYEELGLHLGLPSIAVSDTLKLIERYCQKMGRPLLHLIVVGKASGRPNLDINVEESKKKKGE